MKTTKDIIFKYGFVVVMAIIFVALILMKINIIGIVYNKAQILNDLYGTILLSYLGYMFYSIFSLISLLISRESFPFKDTLITFGIATLLLILSRIII